MLQAFLRFNLPLNGFFAHIACRTGKVGACPQGRKFARDFLKLSPKRKGGDAFEFLSHQGFTI
jgi:hypothetical protein